MNNDNENTEELNNNIDYSVLYNPTLNTTNNNNNQRTSGQIVLTLSENSEELEMCQIYELINEIISEMTEIEIVGIKRNGNLILLDFNFINPMTIAEDIALQYVRERRHEIIENISFRDCNEINKYIGKGLKIKENDEIYKKKETCFICFEEYKLGEYKRLLPECKHYFHKKCIDKWLKRKAQCPICRDKVYKQEFIENELNIFQKEIEERRNRELNYDNYENEIIPELDVLLDQINEENNDNNINNDEDK